MRWMQDASMALPVVKRQSSSSKNQSLKHGSKDSVLTDPSQMSSKASNLPEDTNIGNATASDSKGSTAEQRKNKNRKNGTMTETMLWNIFRDILSGLEYLHLQAMLHRDLKSENVLLHIAESQVRNLAAGGPQRLKMSALLSDFGTTEFKDPQSSTSSSGVNIHPAPRDGWTGTIEFTAPELLEVDPVTNELRSDYDEKSDMWSAGVILYHMVFASLPFMSSNPNTTRKLILESKTVPFPDHSVFNQNIEPPLLHALIAALLGRKPEQRPSAKEVLLNPAFGIEQAKFSVKTTKYALTFDG